MKLTIIIKALNEERNIARALESALAAVAPWKGEVVLADSASTDATVSIASRYPVRVVQLANPPERCCGIGPQLGWQHARGEFVFLMDGDMRVHADFLRHGMAYLEQHPELAGVAGEVIEHNLHVMEYAQRNQRVEAHREAGYVDRLDGGGLYRREAIESVAYFSNRNLHSYEEIDLAVRLRTQGWKLARIAEPAVDHWGHETPPYTLLRRRWKSGYAFGIGEVLRAAIGRPHWRTLVSSLRELRLYLATLGWLFVLLLLPALALATGVPGATAFWTWVALLGLPFLIMSVRKRSLSQGLYSVVSWVVAAAGLVVGLLRQPVSPTRPVDSVLLSSRPPEPVVTST